MKKLFMIVSLLCIITGTSYAQKAELGSFGYDKFQMPKFCGAACHNGFFRQWEQSMMSKAFTHEWDEIEYFQLAVPHAEKDPIVAGVKAGCNGCHAPLAFMAGDIPPQRPQANTRANESVSCDVCHSITGFEGDTPFNFNYIMAPGDTKYTSRQGTKTSPSHKIQVSALHKSGDFCGICHNEKDPYGIWVKSTHLEWKEGPYAKENVQCQDCHMPKAEFRIAAMGDIFKDARLHQFHGAHDQGKVRGTVEIRVYPDTREAEPGEKVVFTVTFYNQKTGHKFPTGSVEDRILWAHVEAVDAKGKVYHLPVDKKGFEGEEYLIGADALAYQDMGIALDQPDFKGVQRDGIPVGDRIFRMPYFDPQGRMTMQQWNTKSLGVDYRIGPRETKVETYSFTLPNDIAPGTLTVNAVLNYQLLVKPVADFLKVPASESEIIPVNEYTTVINVLK